MSRCSWRTDLEIGRWFLPGCIGGAVYGESQCTCRPPVIEPAEDDPSVEDRLTAIEDQLRRIADTLDGRGAQASIHKHMEGGNGR